MKKCKVLLVAYNNLGKGGIQNQLMGIIRSLKDVVDFDVVVWDQVKDYYTPELERYGVRIIRCFRNIGNNVLRRKADAFIRYGDIRRIIANVIREHGPYDVIHCNNAYDAAPCLEAAVQAGIPVRISHAHNTENPNLSKKLVYPAYRMLYAHNRKKILRYATHLIGCSRQVTDYFYGEGLGKVVHVGIDLSAFQNEMLAEKTRDKAELLHVGSMSEQKNQCFLVDIMEELVKLKADAHLTMIGGGGAYLDQVQNKITEKGLAENISILCPETNIPQAMANADLFIFPSTFEGFGIVLIEAQATGLRCLVSDIVSPEADCGGLQYISLGEGAAYWADQINRMLENDIGSREKYDVSEFSVEEMSRKVYRNYSRTGAQKTKEFKNELARNQAYY